MLRWYLNSSSNVYNINKSFVISFTHLHIIFIRFIYSSLYSYIIHIFIFIYLCNSYDLYFHLYISTWSMIHVRKEDHRKEKKVYATHHRFRPKPCKWRNLNTLHYSTDKCSNTWHHCFRTRGDILQYRRGCILVWEITWCNFFILWPWVGFTCSYRWI